MRVAGSALLIGLVALGATARAGTAKISSGPTAARDGGETRISFAVDAPADVDVSILDSSGKVVRHLAAGVLGAEEAPPAPLKAGLAQELSWDGMNDFGETSRGGPFKVRVRAGMGVKFGRMIGQNPMAIGKVLYVATDADGNVYLYCLAGGVGPMKQMVVLDGEGNYLRTLLPFPADLPAGRVSPWARADGRSLLPTNRNSLGPEFYTNADLTLLRSADARGVILTDGRRIYRIAKDGGAVDGTFVHGELWPPKGEIHNGGKAPVYLTPSPDGKYLYLSGPFSSNSYTGHKYNPKFPPGQVYRMEIGKGTMKPFAKLPTDIPIPPNRGRNGLRAPLADVAVDKSGRVLVCHAEKGAVMVLDESGKVVGEFPVPGPKMIVIGPRDGAVYVLSVQRGSRKLLKFAGWKSKTPAATLDLGSDRSRVSGMALSAGKGAPTLWITGLRGGLVKIADKGETLAIAGDLRELIKGPRLNNADRIAVDRETDAVYINDAWTTCRRFDGLTGEGGQSVEFERGAGATDMTIGPRGHVYVQSGPKYSGPLGRYGRDLKPAPYKGTGTHLLSKYIYGRYHPWGGFCEKGIGVGRDGSVYINHMYSFARYYLGGFGPDGRPLAGSYLKGQVGAKTPKQKKNPGYPESYDSAVIGPVPSSGGGVRVDSRGRIYMGFGIHPVKYAPPAGYEKDSLYLRGTGCVIRFGKEGGEWYRTSGKGSRPRNGKAGLEMNAGNFFAGADRYYPGLGPISGRHCDTPTAAKQGCCVCRGPRFDLDMFDRLYVPNAITNSVRVLDNSGNLICEFGGYGNFDSLFVPEGADGGKPICAGPEIPLGWPVGAASSENHVYVSDMLNRRVARVDKTWAAEKTVVVK